MTLKHKNILVGVTGGIACYKVVSLCSLLMKAGANVRVIMTEHAQKFVTKLTLETIIKNPIYTDLFSYPDGLFEIEHISLAQWANAVIVAPATANIMAKAANGIADDLLSTTLLAVKCPLIFAPAMNANMWHHPATQINAAHLIERGNLIMMPEYGQLACGDTGDGRMPEPDTILKFVESAVGAFQNEILADKKVLITSGPTHEYLDPVRFISNPSTGKMGKALAEQALALGANHVYFVTGPVDDENLPQFDNRISIHQVISAQSMYDEVLRLMPDVDIFIFAAAVADYKPKKKAPNKIKKSSNASVKTVEFVQTKDIAKEVGHLKKKGQITVGFAAETEDLHNNALDKLKSKCLDMIVANNILDRQIGFGSNFNEVTIFCKKSKPIALPKSEKKQIAQDIFQVIIEKFIK